jgi:glycosyltransferase 2 family protein
MPVIADMNSLSTSLRKTSSPGPGRLVAGLRLGIPLLLLAGLLARLGTGPFERSLQVLRPGPVVAALLLGAVTTVAQAQRWRTVAAGYGPRMSRARAVAECYRSALLNAVLPGGVMGDAVRVWRQRTPSGRVSLGSSVKAVVGERVAGTALLLLCVSVATLGLDRRISLLMLAGAAVAGLIAVPSLRRLSGRAQLAVWGWSTVSLLALVTKFAIAATVLGTVSGTRDVVTLALISLAGMSVPLAVAGFGPREAVAAIAFVALGLSADAGVATSAGYGVLCAVSALPGVVVMLVDAHRAPRAGGAVVLREEVAEHDGHDERDEEAVLVGAGRPA